jgi:alkylation response protein AidB-like acyl-CoA dehydrogenase
MADINVPAEAPDLSEYRAQVRAWLEGNLERRIGPTTRRTIDDYTPEVIAANRVLRRKLYDAGYTGISWPKEYGGGGLSAEYEAIFAEESQGYVMPDFGFLSPLTDLICIPTMLAHAPPQLLKWFVPKVLSGEALVCQFFSEPSSGSDLAGARTSAVKDGDQWILNGSKIWSTYAHLADWGLCLARTDWDAPKHRGLTWFMVPCHARGVTIRPIRQINESAEFCEDFFDDVIIPDGYRVSEINEGWRVTQTMLVFERGAGRSPIRRTVADAGPLAPDLVQAARHAGRLDDPLVRQRVAQAHIIDYVSEALLLYVGELARAGKLNPGVAAYVKLFAGTYNPIRARLGVEIGGIGSLSWDVENPEGAAPSIAYLSSRHMSIAGGTNEMQRNGIGERVLGLPREPSFDTNKPFRQVLQDAKSWSN